MNIRVLIAAFLLVGCTPAPDPVVEEVPVPVEMQGKWQKGFGMGVTEYTISRTETSGVNVRSYFNISCHHDIETEDIDYSGKTMFGPEYYAVGIYVQFDNQDVKKPILIIDKYTEMDINWLLQDCRACVNNYHAMWNMLRNAESIGVRSEHGVVKEFPVAGIKETLPEVPCTHISDIAYQ